MVFFFKTPSISLKATYVKKPQRVKVENIRNDRILLERGVPKGAIVVPILFNVYINYLLWLLNTKFDVNNYADNSSLAFCHWNPNIAKSSFEEALHISVK